MNGSQVASLAELLPARQRLLRGFLLSASLWIFYLVITSWTSAVTLFDRVDSTEMTRAASSGMWTGKIAFEIGIFLVTQVLLHLVFASLTWMLACATAVVSPNARMKFGRIVVGWFCLLAGAALIYNALWFPRTLLGAYYHDALASSVGPLQVGQIAYLAAVGLCALVTLRAGAILITRSNLTPRRRSIWIGLVLLVVAVGAILLPAQRPGLASTAGSDRPHVILLGIDSLRLEQLRRFGGTGITPNLDRFLANADLFPDATTPAARTYSSWMAILTGRAPVVTGARFNLAERSSVRANPTLADVLRENGYRTIYSTDEVRFANIDESYGFDQVVAPRIGASDFLIGTYNDLPLASLFINTRLGKWIFPYSHANRGVATMFQPGTYLDRIRREVSFDEPTLFISHLTAAHWPYYTSETPFGVSSPTPDNQRPLYRIGLQTADRMFGELLEILESKGALRNALVIVLSDHGEAMGLPSDSFFDDAFMVEGLRSPLKLLDFGHGQSVLSKSQYQVLLAFRSFGSQEFGQDGRSFKFPSTVEDIAPTVLDFLRISGDPLAATGRSLLSILQEQKDPLEVGPDRIRFTETDLAVLPAPGGGVDEIATARHNSIYYEVNSKTGRLHIRPKYAPLVATFKERAAFTPDHLLAAIPAGPYAHQYLFLDFSRRHGRLLLGRPEDDSPEAQRLWDAMAAHFAGELKKPISVTREDWLRIEKEWENFIEVRGEENSGHETPSQAAG
jgi:arylsulfatase A-like enzyme